MSSLGAFAGARCDDCVSNKLQPPREELGFHAHRATGPNMRFAINKSIEARATVFVQPHRSMPVHEKAWKGLFNKFWSTP